MGEVLCDRSEQAGKGLPRRFTVYAFSPLTPSPPLPFTLVIHRLITERESWLALLSSAAAEKDKHEATLVAQFDLLMKGKRERIRALSQEVDALRDQVCCAADFDAGIFTTTFNSNAFLFRLSDAPISRLPPYMFVAAEAGCGGGEACSPRAGSCLFAGLGKSYSGACVSDSILFLARFGGLFKCTCY